MSKDDPLSQAFGVDSEEEASTDIPLFPVTRNNENKFEEYVDADYEFARENIMNTILKANDALDSMIDLAHVAQHPRAYEVLGGLVKTIVDSNKDLLELAKKNKELKKVEAETPVTNNGDITNNLYVGSTSDLQAFLQNNGVATNVKEIIYQKKDKVIDDEK